MSVERVLRRINITDSDLTAGVMHGTEYECVQVEAGTVATPIVRWRKFGPISMKLKSDKQEAAS